MLPPSRDALAALRPLSALILCGGPDLDSRLYHARRHPDADRPQPGRDAWELRLLAAAKELGLPVLGICRGMQLLNIAHGGSLVQALKDGPQAELHRPAVGRFGAHAVQTADGSWCRKVLGPSAVVPTYHHQAIDDVGRGLRAVAWSQDGIIEAIEGVASSMLIGVQWHPEAAPDSPLISRFVEQRMHSSDDPEPLVPQPGPQLEAAR
jgi:putative glutamine amidotransferase